MAALTLPAEVLTPLRIRQGADSTLRRISIACIWVLAESGADAWAGISLLSYVAPIVPPEESPSRKLTTFEGKLRVAILRER